LFTTPPPPISTPTFTQQSNLPATLLSPKTNFLNLTQIAALSSWTGSGIAISAWLKATGTTSNGYQQIMTLGNGLIMSAQLVSGGAASNGNGNSYPFGLSICVTGLYTYATASYPSNCNTATGVYLSSSPVSVFAAPNSNGWIHFVWAAKYSPSLGGSGYYLYANGQLVASQLPGTATGTLAPYNAYYDGSQQRVGFYVSDTAKFAGNLFIGDLQVYSTPGGDDAQNNPASLYLGTMIKNVQTKQLGSIPSIPTTLDAFPQMPDNNHRYMFSKLTNVLGTTPTFSWANISDSKSSNASSVTWSPSNTTSGTLQAFSNAYSQGGFGVSLGSLSSYIDLGARDYGISGLTGAGEAVSATSPGFSTSFWVYRAPLIWGNATAASGTNATRLLTIIGNTFDGYNYSIGMTLRTGNLGYSIDVSWPSCQYDAEFTAAYSAGSLATPGYHNVIVSHGTLTSMQVWVDGLAYAYRGQSAPTTYTGCDLSYSTWPANFTASNAFLGSYGSVDTTSVTFALMDAAFYLRQLNSTDAALIWANGPAGAADSIAAPPPPAVAGAGASSNLPRLTACASAPPIHRYGDWQTNPFPGGVVADSNASAPWNGVWRVAGGASPSFVAPYSDITLGNLTTYYTSEAYIDFGEQTFTGAGLSVGMLVSNTATAVNNCTVTATSTSTNGFPSSTALFDIGGYSVYSVVTSCAAGYTSGVPNIATYVTSPGGAIASYQGIGNARNPFLPIINERYTFVTFGATNGARIYVNGMLWSTFPTVTYTPGTFMASVRAFLGDTHNAGSQLQITLRDLQIYDRELQPADVASLSRGVAFGC